MTKARLAVKVRAQVAARSHQCCEYCRSQEEYSPDSFAVEHIVPTAKGGAKALENLAYSCQGCNNHKYISLESIDPVTQTKVSLYNPRQQIWTEHFTWDENCRLIVGLTKTGRATVERLRLNRQGLINLRRVLYDRNAHPPGF
jgi:5-methylcytosine-specific restriction endonuclease McrA